jgi:hypothetical protein
MSCEQNIWLTRPLTISNTFDLGIMGTSLIGLYIFCDAAATLICLLMK